MALQILKNPAQLPDLSETHYHHAIVQSRVKTGLGRIFGPRAGTVSVAPGCDPDDPVIRAVPPAWQGGEKDEWELLKQCYAQALALAWEHHCDAVVIPLLTAEDPRFPAYIDYKIAVDTIREFLEEHPMDVFLVAAGPAAYGMPELRKDVERFLASHFCEDILPWSNRPFAVSESRFATLAPAGFSAAELSEEDLDAIFSALPEDDREKEAFIEEDPDWDDLEEDDDFAPKAPARKKSAPMLPKPAPKKAQKQKNSSLFATGALPSKEELDRMLRKTDAGFSETLLKLIDQSGKKDSEVYNKANVSRQHFSKIRNNPDYKPTKATAIAFAIALELDLAQTEDLIGRAGYALTNSSKFDVIIMYFIQSGNYNMFDINDTLYEYDQSLLGA